MTCCSVGGCDKPVYVIARGLCQRHYHRWWRTGDPLCVPKFTRTPTYTAMHRRLEKLKTGRCSHCDGRDVPTHMALIKGRGTLVSNRGRPYSTQSEDYIELCVSCHNRYDKPPPKRCSVEGCERKYLASGYCSVHYDRWRRHGDPLAEGHQGVLA